MNRATAPLPLQEHHDGHGLADSMTISADSHDTNAGGASHYYEVSMAASHTPVASITFQHGPRNAKDSTPGILDSVLVAVLLDRLRAFQSGPFPSRQNAIIITKLEECMMWMHNRADERARRGVLGHNEK